MVTMNEFLRETFAVALDGSMLSAWADIETYDADDEVAFNATIRDRYTGTVHTVDRTTLENGIRAIASGSASRNFILVAAMRKVLADPENVWAIDLDSADADCIVQVGLFGKVVYG